MDSRSLRIWALLIIDFIFLLVEITVGYTVGSLALVADAFHMLNDVLSLVVALYAIKVSANSPTSKYSYGWHRAEILAALVNGVFLLALCLSIFLEAIQRFSSVPKISNPKLVVIVGSLGLASNILGFFLFHGKPKAFLHGHTPGPDHGHAHSMNMHAVLLHVLGDALGNVGVISSGLIIWLTTWSWKYYSDPIISLVITCIIFRSALPLVKRASFILLQAVPRSISLDAVRSDIEAISGVLSLHELHVWELSENKIVASVHVCVAHEGEEGSRAFMEVAGDIRKVLHGYEVHSSTIQPEFFTVAGHEAQSPRSGGGTVS
ncbi:cation efflux protein [Cantharellus anzutake]|uniref:cation efflux protein n=1 Tax=Cantharellus anzutake TaxID=1750568 RepID=UPI0019037264|nr:cation efflux protein [Cantharellus anzutake]KAF8340606.1 cation efflux protein [Cantharellus anzutake]